MIAGQGSDVRPSVVLVVQSQITDASDVITRESLRT